MGWRVWLELGRHDIRMRYKRTLLGPLWISLSMAATFTAMSMLYSALLKTDIHSFLPYLGAGMVLWGLASSTVNEAPQIFLNSRHIITSMQMPLTVHVIRCVVRNTIIFFHNLVIYVVVALALGVRPMPATLFVFVGIPIFLMSAYFIALIVAIVGARFRDIAPVVGTVTQFLFFLTPIIWSPEHIPDGKKYWVTANPFHHLIEIVRAPLLGTVPPVQSLVIATAFTAILAVVSFLVFRSLRRRIIYWL